jgi:hypothetical protein
LCCKVLGVRGVDKPQYEWCTYCTVGKGCTIYADRPQDCRDFNCTYIMPGSMVGEHWFPARSKMVLCSDPSVPLIEIHVDKGMPDNWRKEPFYSDLKAWSQRALQDEGQIMVCLPDRNIVILPDRDVDLGKVEKDEVLLRSERMTPSGPVLDIEKVKADDPRLARR